jgi:NADPH-dependent 7-cyano-7-deazaguanine reductase QueF
MKLKKVKIQKGSRIEYHSKELLFLAQSGQPYRGSLTINFISQGESFDLLELKKYITSLRAEKFYAEDIAYEIYQTITHSISTLELGVVVDLSARGGIQQRISYGEQFSPTKKENIFQI